jgi:lipopolysaccharide/colanic/teichoic acid biosynthesis glycosyltransferase
MTAAKRLFDLTVAVGLGLVLALPFAVLVIWILLREGRPVFYLSERMKTPQTPFLLWKLRTMRPAADDSGVTGGDKAARITPTGAILRRARLDEIPQLWNVIRGDMSFVGPRPPLRQYVERFPEIYAKVLQSRPGITGLATLHFHRHEEWLISQARSAGETDAIYARRCIPRKARLDLIYAARRNLCLDAALMWQTFVRVLPRRRR